MNHAEINVKFNNGVLTNHIKTSEGEYFGPLDGENKLHGEGFLRTFEGNVYEGAFEHGILISATLTYPKGMIEKIHLKTKYGEYSGPVDEENELHGKGIIVTPDNGIFEVHFNKGKLVDSYSHEIKQVDFRVRNKKAIYSGIVNIDNKPNEAGILKFEDGSVHEGVFSKGNLKTGKMTLWDGAQILTINDEKDSVSKQVMGTFQSGYFKSGQLNGEGEKHFTQDVRGHELKVIEKGNFSQGKLSGYGEREIQGQNAQKGWFINGEFQYEIKRLGEDLYFASKPYSKFDDNGLQGNGKKRTSDGTTYEGNFVNGLLDGKVKVIPNKTKFPDKKPEYRIFKNGVEQ